MSELDGVMQGVGQVRGEVAQATIVSQQAQSAAGDKSSELALLGLEGVARVLNSVAELMGAAVSQLGVAYQSTDECVSGLEAVTDGTKLSVTSQALQAAIEKLTVAGNQCQQASAQANDALAQAQESEVEPVMHAVVAAIGAIDQAVVVAETAKVKTGEYRKTIDEAGKGLLATNSSGGGPPVSEPVAKIGDQVQAPQGGPDATSHFRAELKSTDDDDSEGSAVRARVCQKRQRSGESIQDVNGQRSELHRRRLRSLRLRTYRSRHRDSRTFAGCFVSSNRNEGIRRRWDDRGGRGYRGRRNHTTDQKEERWQITSSFERL